MPACDPAIMLDRADITSVHWQMRRSPEGEAVFGDIAAELEDLAQEIRQCILTPKRSVPLNPEKGCDLEPFRDRPNTALHLLVASEVRNALERDVPRIVVTEVKTTDLNFSGIGISVGWRPRETVLDSFVVTEVQYAF